MPNTIVVALSGGVDSLAALAIVLETFEDDRVIAHHVDFHNSQARGEPETLACRECVDWMQRNVRAFEYTESVIRYDCFKHAPTWTFIAPAVAVTAQLTGATHICDGRRLHGSGGPGGIWPQAFHDQVAPVYRMLNPDYKAFFPVQFMGKAEVLRHVPEPLLDRFWSCRAPLILPTGWAG